VHKIELLDIYCVFLIILRQIRSMAPALFPNVVKSLAAFFDDVYKSKFTAQLNSRND